MKEFILLLTLALVGCSGEDAEITENELHKFNLLTYGGNQSIKLRQLPSVEVLDFFGDSFSVRGNHTDDILYDECLCGFNFDELYSLIDSSGVQYEFRHGWQTYNDGVTTFKNVKWVDNKEPKLVGQYDVFAVDNSMPQNGDLDVVIIGDSTSWWNNGQLLRSYIASKTSLYNFVGSKTDTLGFGHEGEGGDGTKQVLGRLDDVPRADICILMVGTNDRFEPQKTVDNIGTIYNQLENDNGCTVVISNLLPRTDEHNYCFNLVNELLLNTALNVIDTNSAFKLMDEYKKELPDNIHPSLKGYDLISDFFIKELSLIHGD